MAKQNVNKVILLGNLGNDPELRTTPKGKQVASFSLATSQSRKDEEGKWVQDTTWHKTTLWGHRAENAARYLTKGDRVYVEGTLQARNWTDKTGTVRKMTEVKVEDIKYLSVKSLANRSENLPTESAIMQ